MARDFQKFIHKIKALIFPSSHQAVVDPATPAATAPNKHSSSEDYIARPQNHQQLVDFLKDLDNKLMSATEKATLAATMTLTSRSVKELMLPKSEMTFVHDMDFLGPLMLDKLYRSGYEDFPVLSPSNDIIGMLNTSNFNNLSIKETDRVIKYINHDLYYLNEKYSIERALNAFLRVKTRQFLVVNQYKQIVGMLTLQDLLEYLLGGRELGDDFARDDDIALVASRR